MVTACQTLCETQYVVLVWKAKHDTPTAKMAIPTAVSTKDFTNRKRATAAAAEEGERQNGTTLAALPKQEAVAGWSLASSPWPWPWP